MEQAHIHPQLLADCHHLGRFLASDVLLHRNAAIPWFILVPDTRLEDVLDLPDEHRQAVLAECVAVSAFIKQVLGFDKVNFAGLGNVVPQMHLHIIGRHKGDPCWPQPVWGNLPEGETYATGRLREWQGELAKMAGLAPASL
ncbi:MAG: HIT family protein [Gammaproteobacteria bacterium]|nr:MAG: HIT family protein [Gammaproteobacteria bacterium]RLA56861.1 MAG: HIT family protein [Gammaproteobacteria bacterium]